MFRELGLVCCKKCDAMRWSEIEECFCGETATKAAPAERQDKLEGFRPKDSRMGWEDYAFHKKPTRK